MKKIKPCFLKFQFSAINIVLAVWVLMVLAMGPMQARYFSGDGSANPNPDKGRVPSTTASVNYSVTRLTSQTYTSIATTVLGGDNSGTLSTATGDETAQTGINIGSIGFSYQGSPVTAVAIHPNGYIVLNNGFYTYNSASSWDNTLSASNGGSGSGAPDLAKRNVLAPFYDDLYKIGPDPVIFYKISGTRFIAEWRNTAFFGVPGIQLNFQVVIDGSDESIRFNYGDMQAYNGTQNIRYSYTCGISGSTVSIPVQAGEIMQQQYENTAYFTHENNARASWGANGHAIAPTPHSSILFTPGSYVPVSPPANLPPSNDEAPAAIALPVLSLFPTNIAWNYAQNQSNLYTTRHATSSSQPFCSGSPSGARDVWFKFTATGINTIVRIYPSGGFIPQIEVLNNALTPLSPGQCTVATQAGMVVDANMNNLIPGSDYYVRVYHSRTGTTAIATATVSGGAVTGVTVTTPGTNYSVPAAAFYYSPQNQGPIIRVTGGGGNGAAVALTIPATTATTTQVLPTLNTPNLSFTGGTGYTSAPTITIDSPDWGITGEFGILVVEGTSVCATPEATPPGGDYGPPPTVTLSCATPGATIYYTTNGTVPGPSNASSKTYTLPITVSIASMALKAKAYKSGFAESTSLTANYTVANICEGVSITPVTGSYSGSQLVTMSCPTSGARLYYTTNGNVPSPGSVYTSVYSQPFWISASASIRAFASKTDYVTGPTAVSNLTVSGLGTLGAVSFSLPGAGYANPVNVALSTLETGTVIYYTRNGNTPLPGTGYTYIYSAPVPMILSGSLKAFAYKPGYFNGPVQTANYSITNPGIVATPVILPGTGTFPGPQNVIITCSTPGANIYYTTNGNNPNVGTSFTKLYSVPFTIGTIGLTTVRAMATASGLLNSNVATSYITLAGSNGPRLEEERTVEFGSELTIFPNPARNQITLLGLPGNRDTEISVLNSLGQHVMKQSSRSTESALDLSGISPGIYQLEVIYEETRKMIRLVKE